MQKAALTTLTLAIAGWAAAQYSGPTPYLQFSDSPFASTTFSQYFHLEDFEDGSLNTPGVSASGGSVLSSGPLTDSVDADDGAIDGWGTAGTSSYSLGQNSIRFTFNSGVLGSLPTHAGIVWTDVGYTNTGLGYGNVEFEAFDSLGSSLGVLTGANFGDGLANGATAEDRFFGITNLSGISAIELRMPESTDWEMDHLQYGAVPEPATLLAVGGGLVLLARRRRKRGTGSR